MARETVNISGGREITTKALAELVLRLTGSKLKPERERNRAELAQRGPDLAALKKSAPRAAG